MAADAGCDTGSVVVRGTVCFCVVTWGGTVPLCFDAAAAGSHLAEYAL